MNIKSYTKKNSGWQIKGEIKNAIPEGPARIDKIEIVPFGKTGCEFTIYSGPSTRTFRTSLDIYDLIITN